MAEAIHVVDQLDSERCRATARHRFPLERMVQRYLDYHHRLAAR
jgi:hypothetical protein